MRIVVLTLLLLLPAIGSHAQKENPDFDPQLARELGADPYGMKNYVFVILTSGTDTLSDREQRNQLFAGHLRNIRKLAEEDRLIVAGPFGDNELDYRGLFILDVSGREEAKELLQTDPAIKAGLLDFELLDWYGSAALKTYMAQHKKIEKKTPG